MVSKTCVGLESFSQTRSLRAPSLQVEVSPMSEPRAAVSPGRRRGFLFVCYALSVRGEAQNGFP